MISDGAGRAVQVGSFAAGGPLTINLPSRFIASGPPLIASSTWGRPMG
jgi:hypothetical protein